MMETTVSVHSGFGKLKIVRVWRKREAKRDPLRVMEISVLSNE